MSYEGDYAAFLSNFVPDDVAEAIAYGFDDGEPEPYGRVKPKKELRLRVFRRDDYICHLCGLPCDRSEVWPHPLAATADHFPIARCDGGRATLDNLRTAHSLCNGSTSIVRRGVTWYVADQRGNPVREVRTGYVITPDQQKIVTRIRTTMPRQASERLGKVSSEKGGR